jgi:hypothetical protein
MDLFVEDWDWKLHDGKTLPVIDREKGDSPVGEVKIKGSGGLRYADITLFNRYNGVVKTYEECIGFLKGVGEVLEYMIE